jgi:hypothetical protein
VAHHGATNWGVIELRDECLPFWSCWLEHARLCGERREFGRISFSHFPPTNHHLHIRQRSFHGVALTSYCIVFNLWKFAVEWNASHVRATPSAFAENDAFKARSSFWSSSWAPHVIIVVRSCQYPFVFGLI